MHTVDYFNISANILIYNGNNAVVFMNEFNIERYIIVMLCSLITTWSLFIPVMYISEIKTANTNINTESVYE